MHANINIHTIYILICLHMYMYITAHTHKYVQTFILTYIITPWTRVLLVKLTFSQLVKKFPVFYGSESSLPLLQELVSCPYPEPPPTSWWSILILSSHLRLGPKMVLSHRFPRQNVLSFIRATQNATAVNSKPALYRFPIRRYSNID